MPKSYGELTIKDDQTAADFDAALIRRGETVQSVMAKEVADRVQEQREHVESQKMQPVTRPPLTDVEVK